MSALRLDTPPERPAPHDLVARVPRRQAWCEAGWVGVVAVLATAGFTWPLAADPVGRLAAPGEAGDAWLNLWVLGWDLRTLGTNSLALLTGRIVDAPIFFPAAQTLAYSDHLILQAVAVWPLHAVTGNLVLCYNAILFGSFCASAMAMYGFVRAATGSRAGAVVAALAWGFMPFRFAHSTHLPLQSLYLLPVAFWLLHRVMAGRRRRDAVWLGVAAAGQVASSVCCGVIGSAALGVAAVALSVGIGRWRSLLIARRLALAAAVGAVVAAPFVWPYLRVQPDTAGPPDVREGTPHVATAISYLRVPSQNLIYGRTGLLRPADGPAGTVGHEGSERTLFPGFALLGLALLGAWRGWRSDARPYTLAMGAVTVLGVVLSFGLDGVQAIVGWLHETAFGSLVLLAPARFGVLVSFGLAGLAALSFRRFGRYRRPPAWMVALWILVVSLEYLSVPLSTSPAPSLSTPVGRWLAAAPGAGAVVYLPLHHGDGNTVAMIESLEHGRPIVNGYGVRQPAGFSSLVDVVNRFPAAETLWTLRDLGVRFVVSPGSVSATDAGPLVERARLGTTTIYELVWTASAEAVVPRPVRPRPMEGRGPALRDQ